MTTRHRPLIARAALYLGALALFAAGVDHLEQYAVDQFSTVPTIGVLFLLNFISCTLVAIGLVAPLGRVLGRRAEAARVLLALAGISIALASLAGLFISETVGLFGFMDHGYRLTIVEAIVSEVAAALFLAVFLVLDGFRPRRDDADVGRPAAAGAG